MLPRIRGLLVLSSILCAGLGAASCGAQQGEAAPVVRYHFGDDPDGKLGWAKPDFDDDDPAAVLAALNRRLHGRLRGGFATCLVLRLDAAGKCRIANAGHLPPFLNGREVDLPPALPLGLAEDLDFDSMELQMAVADRLTLYTDGLLEARNAAGELFGFARIAAFLDSPRDASEVADAAQQFGQEDDITVLSLTVIGAA